MDQNFLVVIKKDTMKKFILSIGVITVIMQSCQKNSGGYKNDNYSFDATLPITTIAVTDSASFELFDNPDVIAFYSGELGNNYVNRERTVLTGGSLKVKFDTRVINKPADTLEVLLSNDFSGIYDSANVANATWKKLTNKFAFPLPTTPLGSFISSGITPGEFTDITDSVIAGQPFYFAFRYDINKNNNIEWSVSKLGLYNFFNNNIPTATVIDSTTNNSGNFAAVKFGETINRWTKTSTLYKCLNSNSSKIGASHWYISRPLNPNAVSPDLPIIVKNITQIPIKKFLYKYKNPGIYKAYFVASYTRVGFEKTFVKEFTVVVQ
jgi:hypothetical protein